MALSDCENCWDTPCTCGFNWRFWTDERLQQVIQTLEKVRRIKRETPGIENDKEAFKEALRNG